MTEILFTTSAAPKRGPFFCKEKRPPLGVGFLISTCRANNVEARFVDRFLRTPSRMYNPLEADYVAISANTICWRDTLAQINHLQQLRDSEQWSGKIILGGPHTSVAPETIPDTVDHIIQGEGEIALMDIINEKTNERWIRKPRLTNLDQLPWQPWDIFYSLPYDFGYAGMPHTRPVFTLNTSRGCPFGCAFCSVESIWGKKYTAMSPDRIISEIKYLQERYNAKGIYFREDNFTFQRSRLEQFCSAMIKELPDIVWVCESRVDNMDPDLITKMANAGCKAVYLGVESGSQKMLNAMNKKITVEQIRAAVRAFEDAGINTCCSLVAGFPGETQEDWQLTEELLKELNPHSSAINVFTGLPGSPAYINMLQNGNYEYIDDVGLMYPPEYDICARYHYGLSGEHITGHKWNNGTHLEKVRSSVASQQIKTATHRAISKIIGVIR